jgi:hypothetical protein
MGRRASCPSVIGDGLLGRSSRKAIQTGQCQMDEDPDEDPD